ncbi:MAG: hypothetical protein HQK88_01015 [Nitrospirae bacterium]|nr:hypothetical protein [Nitrospirota bacterium]MBF0535075.1 hypothetical protein [Nitrospirota bacterium]MBF0615375.1 hypothetical protein [Nitrospirota bacterium]
MKRSLVYVLLLALVLTGMGIYGAGKVDAGSYVRFIIPYLHTNTNNAVYCVVSNMGGTWDNISRTVMQVGSNTSANSSTGLILPDDASAYTLMTYRSSQQFTFSGQYVYIGTANTEIFDLTGSTSTNSALGAYSAKLTFVAASTGANPWNAFSTNYSNLDCKKMSMSCFQGTTSPKRNLVGYTCEAGTYDGTTYRVYKSISITSAGSTSGNTNGSNSGLQWIPGNMDVTGNNTTSGTDNSTDLAY